MTMKPRYEAVEQRGGGQLYAILDTKLVVYVKMGLPKSTAENLAAEMNA